MLVGLLSCFCREGIAAIGPDHSIKLSTQNAYLPVLPVLVRIELHNPAGTRDSDIWDIEANLTATPPVTLSTNKIILHNGIGSALVTFSGGGDFDLTATIGSLQTNRTLQSVAALPVTLIGGTLGAGTTTWSGVVRVTNDLTVPTGSTLVIQSNTLVLIDGFAGGTITNDIFVSGTIRSEGTEEYPVTITCSTNGLRWGQIRHNTAQPSTYRFTSITRGGRAPGEGHTSTGPVLRPNASTITLESCNITDHAETRRGVAGFGTPGKAMYAINSTLIMRDCLLARCRMGPEIEGTSLACTNTCFMEMFGPDDADGIYLHTGPSMFFDQCLMAYGDDDGIDTLDSVVNVSNCIVRDWSNLLEDAKGISVFSGATRLHRCLVTDCTIPVSAKTTTGSSVLVTINECTITGVSNSVVAAYKNTSSGPTIDYRITNSVLRAMDAVKSDFGPTNFTIRYCNISEVWPGTGNGTNDPLFADAPAHDFHLLPYSPCIDAGNPTSPVDADGSPIDIGFYTFIPSAPVLTNAVAMSPFQFTLNAYSNRNYVVEFSTNPPVWTALQTNFQSSESLVVQDNSAGDSPVRFYRAHLAQ